MRNHPKAELLRMAYAGGLVNRNSPERGSSVVLLMTSSGSEPAVTNRAKASASSCSTAWCEGVQQLLTRTFNRSDSTPARDYLRH
ncbi:hypothetical protein ABZ923_38815 [Streptomyces sp. NPDC046881]|uniref:hypothetical protein n=1 Tax=Streptomyces sp. NPDC046881 TaxID=3155374 RepID=UPI0034058CE8